MTKVCRLCLSRLQRGSKYFNINAVESFTGFMPYRDQLTTCIPEMALDLIPNPVICNNCRTALKSSYDFKSRCLLVEKKIREYAESLPLETTEFDLSVIDTSELPKITRIATAAEVEQAKKDPKAKSNQEKRQGEPESKGSSLLSNLLTLKKEEYMFNSPAQASKSPNKCKEPTQNSVDPLSRQTPVGGELVQIHGKMLMCNHCNMGFNDVPSLHRHKQNLHAEEFLCNFCNQPFSRLQSLRKHNIQCQKDSSGEKFVSRKDIYNIIKGSQEPNFDKKLIYMEETLINSFCKDEDERIFWKDKLSLIKSQFRSRWQAARRTKGLFEKNNSDWLDGVTSLPLYTTATQGVDSPNQTAISSMILTKRPHLPMKAKNHLKKWLFKHTDHPYPTDVEKQQLMKETDLSLLQVENWFINARRRILGDLTKLKNMRGRGRQKTHRRPDAFISAADLHLDPSDLTFEGHDLDETFDSSEQNFDDVPNSDISFSALKKLNDSLQLNMNSSMDTEEENANTTDGTSSIPKRENSSNGSNRSEEADAEGRDSENGEEEGSENSEDVPEVPMNVKMEIVEEELEAPKSKPKSKVKQEPQNDDIDEHNSSE